ncbi:hypothetical protein EV1_021708 [Malus domestica]
MVFNCLFLQEVKGAGAGLTAAALIAMGPSHISCSVAGSYDNEVVAIFALVFTLYLYIRIPLLCNSYCHSILLHGGLGNIVSRFGAGSWIQCSHDIRTFCILFGFLLLYMWLLSCTR